jgi:hypothetical protein
MTARRRGPHRPHYGSSAYARIPNDAYFTKDARCGAALTDRVRLPSKVWEPACGARDLARQLQAGGVRRVVCSDILRYAPGVMTIADFLLQSKPLGRAQAIVTNPPNKLSYEFAEHALRLMAPVGGLVALLVPLQWDAAPGRKHLVENHRAYALKLLLTFRSWWTDERRAQPREHWQWLVWDWNRRRPAVVRYA